MLKNRTFTPLILLAAIGGGLIGFIAPVLAGNEQQLFAIPGLRSILAVSPFSPLITTTIAGMVAGALAAAFAFAIRQSRAPLKLADKIKILLREERLDIGKKRVNMADLHMRKERITDEKVIKVPLTRENLVLEKVSGEGSAEGEIVRIPLSEEQVEVIKHPRRLSQVNISNKAYTVLETVEETLKKEKLTTGSRGNAQIREK